MLGVRGRRIHIMSSCDQVYGIYMTDTYRHIKYAISAKHGISVTDTERMTYTGGYT